jgi:hypothetical protein
MKLFIIFAAITQITAIQFATNQCNKGWTKIGCYHDRVLPDRPLPNELVNRRDPINNNFDGYYIDWDNYNTTLHALACTCAGKAHSLRHEYFGLQFFGECWSGVQNPTFGRDGLGKAGDCINGAEKTCNDHDDNECIGDQFTNYIYKVGNIIQIIDGNWSEWGVWSKCSKSCDGGEHTRQRYCNNPAPANGGKDCIGNSSQVGICNAEPCFGVCQKELELALALDTSSSVSKTGWNKTLEFVLDLSRALNIDVEKVHLGIVKFNQNVFEIFKPSERVYWSNKAVENIVRTMKFEYGRTRIDLAIDDIRKSFFCDSCGIRKDVPKVMIVITDGKNSKEGVLDIAAKRAKNASINTIAVGVGPLVDNDELKMIASGDHVFKITNYDYIAEYLNNILKTACEKK